MVAVIVIKIWRSFPFMMLSLLAALQVIDKSLYEAGKNRRGQQLATLLAHHDASPEEHLHYPGHPDDDLEH